MSPLSNLKTPIEPVHPQPAVLRHFVTPALTAAAAYKIDAPRVPIKLDQNESPWDLPAAVKNAIANRLVEKSWNRYPTPFANELTQSLATYAGVTSSALLIGPGSNYLIALLLDAFTKHILPVTPDPKQSLVTPAPGVPSQLIIARPSFPLYESHCRAQGIPYQTWDLNADLEYDLAAMPTLTPGSMVVFASPNNPVGNVLPRSQLAALASRNPQTLFVADEAYFEYATAPYTELLADHGNLILVRTFSKTMGAAGVRIGYLVAAAPYIDALRKLQLPYLLSHFQITCAEVLLQDPAIVEHFCRIRDHAIAERDRVYRRLAALAPTRGFAVKDSEANFLLLRWQDPNGLPTAYANLLAGGILVRNVANAPGLAGCLRVTIGTASENDALLSIIARWPENLG